MADSEESGRLWQTLVDDDNDGGVGDGDGGGDGGDGDDDNDGDTQYKLIFPILQMGDVQEYQV